MPLIIKMPLSSSFLPIWGNSILRGSTVRLAKINWAVPLKSLSKLPQMISADTWLFSQLILAWFAAYSSISIPTKFLIPKWAATNKRIPVPVPISKQVAVSRSIDLL